MKILLLTNLFPPDYDGGYELNAWKVANGLRGRGHQVDVLTSRWRAGFAGDRTELPWVHRILENRPHLPPSTWKMPWVRLPMLWHLVYRESIAWVNVPRVRRFLGGRSYDLAYIFGLHDVGLGCAYPAQEAGIPTLWHFGDHFVADHQGRYTYSFLFSLFGRTVLRSVKSREQRIRFEHAAFVSRFLEGYFAERGVRPAHSYVIPRGIEFPMTEAVDRPRDDPPVFLMASRLGRDKGIHIALEAARILSERRPGGDWRLHIAGSGDAEHEARLRNLSELCPPGSVEFLGRLSREEVIGRMRSATAFVSASVWGEPFANTVIEALAAGTPLIASDAGSIFEVVQDGTTALVYEKDSPAALADRMERILGDPELRTRLAVNGLKRIEEGYTMDAILDRTEDVMRRAVTT